MILSEMECNGEGVELVGVLTNPDTPQGRVSLPVPTEVSETAANLSVSRQERGFPPILQLKYEKLDAHARKEIVALHCDLLVTFAYGRIFGPKFLALFPRGGINVHPSLLPRYRGPSPIPASILNRDRETGISIQKLALQMDAGDILAQEKIPLDLRETTASLTELVASRAGKMLGYLMMDFLSDKVKAEPQQGEPVYCSLITKEQGIINWNRSAVEIDSQVRAYTPWPLCYTHWRGEELYILEGLGFPDAPSGVEALPGFVKGIDRVHGIIIQTGDGVYAVSRLQRRGKKALDWKAFYNGTRDFLGSRLEYQNGIY
jgi:methionyl-tRNA formyltransferase